MISWLKKWFRPKLEIDPYEERLTKPCVLKSVNIPSGVSFYCDTHGSIWTVPASESWHVTKCDVKAVYDIYESNREKP